MAYRVARACSGPSTSRPPAWASHLRADRVAESPWSRRYDLDPIGILTILLIALVVVAAEAAFAYKDIESVMAASTSLVRPTKRLTPLGVVKG